MLCQHVETSIELGDQMKSKLDRAAFQARGFTSPKVRHLLNNLGSLDGLDYLEVGVHRGAMFVATNYKNIAGFFDGGRQLVRVRRRRQGEGRVPAPLLDAARPGLLPLPRTGLLQRDAGTDRHADQLLPTTVNTASRRSARR